MTTPQSELELLLRWRDGDQDAGAVLVERHFPMVFRFFARRLPDPEVTKDLCQKTFLAAVEGLHRLRDATRLRGYLLGIARHAFTRHLRDNKRKQTADQRLEASPRTQTTSMGSRLARRQDAQHLVSALRALPEELQLTVELYYWEGLSTTEIGEATEVAAGTVKWRLSKAREIVRAALQQGELSPPSPETSTTEGLERWAREIQARRS